MKPSISFVTNPVTQMEGFESATVNSFFTITNPSSMTGTNAGWQRTNTKADGGAYSFTNEDISDSQTARFDLSFTVPNSAKNIFFTFSFFQDCEELYDGLKLYYFGELLIDFITEAPYGAWSGAQIDLSDSPGEQKFTFEFFKDESTLAGTDSVYIDSFEVYYEIDTIGEIPGTELIRFDGSTGYSLLYQRTGAQAPPISFVEQRIPFQPGSIYQHTDIQPRDIELGILIEGNTPDELRNRIRDLTHKLIGIDGALYCRYTDGSERRLYCRYKEGLEGEESRSTMGSGYFQKVVLIFRAFDPFWYSTGKVESKDASKFIQYKNNGSYEAYPIIYIDGPCSNPDIAVWQIGTGGEPPEGSSQRLKLNYVVPDGRRLIVDMKKKTVKLDDGTNLYSYIDSVANKFNSIPPDGSEYDITYDIDVDIGEPEGEGYYHVYIQTPHWGI